MIEQLNRAWMGRWVMHGLVATAALFVIGCDDSSQPSKAPESAPARVSIKLQLNWVPEPEFGGIFAALQDGLYASEGLDVEVLKGGAQVPSAQLAASGKVEFAIVSGEEVLTLRAQGGKLTAVFATFQENPTGFLVHEKSPIKSLEELWKSATTIGVDPGLPFVKILNEKYPGGAIKLVPYSGALATFLATPDYVQQCFITAEPVECQLRSVATRVLTVAPIFNPYAAVIATSEKFAADSPQVVEKFVRATGEGWRRYLRTPAVYNPAISALNPSMSLEAMNIAATLEAKLIEPAVAGQAIGSMTIERWSELAKQLEHVGMIPVGTDVASAFAWRSVASPESAR